MSRDSSLDGNRSTPDINRYSSFLGGGHGNGGSGGRPQNIIMHHLANRCHPYRSGSPSSPNRASDFRSESRVSQHNGNVTCSPSRHSTHSAAAMGHSASSGAVTGNSMGSIGDLHSTANKISGEMNLHGPQVQILHEMVEAGTCVLIPLNELVLNLPSNGHLK